MIRNRKILLVFRLVVGGIFIYAGVTKAVDPLGFAQNIRNYRVVGQNLSFLTGLILPWLEIFAGLLVVSGVMRRAGALLAFLMLAFFIVLTAVTMARGLDVDCGCFGAVSRKAGLGLILEDAALLYMAAAVLLSRVSRAGR
jgi:putative oxidoreductase